MLSFKLFFFFIFFLVLLSDRQDAQEPDVFTDLSQPQAIDYELSSNAAESPYFSGGSNRRSSGQKRKRATRATGGEKKLVKKGKWYGKSKASKEKKSTSATSFQRNASGSSFNKSATPYKSAASKAGPSSGLLAPPRSRSVKKD